MKKEEVGLLLQLLLHSSPVRIPVGPGLLNGSGNSGGSKRPWQPKVTWAWVWTQEWALAWVQQGRAYEATPAVDFCLHVGI